MDVKQCKKQTTVAIIVKEGQLISIGCNEIFADIDECPRKGMASGEGYELCKNICKQKHHAEVDACLGAGEAARGGTLILIGHTYCCDNCKRVMDKHGIAKVKIIENCLPTVDVKYTVGCDVGNDDTYTYAVARKVRDITEIILSETCKVVGGEDKVKFKTNLDRLAEYLNCNAWII